MCKYIKRVRNDAGFTFFEALLQLVVLLIFSQLLLLIVLSIPRFDSTEVLVDLNWELFINDLQKYVLVADEIQVRNNGDELLIVQGEQKNYISQSNEMIRTQLNSGNEVLFVGVESIQFQENDNEIKLVAQLLDGREKERIFIVPPPQE
ncbi:competence type IV pilus minor pilin ComGF [Solibacillus sp. CAU 1738]|uniref:competence type IV pilus minor pilin ComGF n=1 Tax=Solibacillus sp. CAU 1738 TaxID=3140363 RepID=UPI0032604ABA